MSGVSSSGKDAGAEAKKPVSENYRELYFTLAKRNLSLAAALREAEKDRNELVAAARPFGEMAQEILTGHRTGHIPAGALERFLSALAAAAGQGDAPSPIVVRPDPNLNNYPGLSEKEGERKREAYRRAAAAGQGDEA